MTAAFAVDLALVIAAILLLVSLANSLRIPYPIALVLGGMALGYIPGVPPLQMPPSLVLVVFLPPLLYWESVTAPISEFFSKSGLWWMFQLAFGLVVVTMLAVSVVAHKLIPTMAWAPALVLGAVVASTDEVALGQVVEGMRLPRHVVATIEGESLVNDATSLLLYGIAVGAVISLSFSLPHAFGDLAISVVGAVVIGIAAGLCAAAAWHFTRANDELQGIVSLMTPYLAYLPAWYFGISAVLAVVAAGFTVTRFTPRVLTPRARERIRGFWVNVVFMLNALIFVLVGMQFHSIMSSLHSIPIPRLVLYGAAISATVIIVRFAWVFLQALLPATNEPEHEEGKADWSHVAVLAWSGMRGGVSLAAALAIPLETSTGPFPNRNLIIFLTFCVLIVTLIGQGGTMPWLLRWLRVRGDEVDTQEERVALQVTAKAALHKLNEIEHERDGISPSVAQILRQRFTIRWSQFGLDGNSANAAIRLGAQYRELMHAMIDAQRAALIDLRNKGKIDNTVMRRVERLLDLGDEELDLLEKTGQSPLGED
jgi:Na+/H+ antiporter